MLTSIYMHVADKSRMMNVQLLDVHDCIVCTWYGSFVTVDCTRTDSRSHGGLLSVQSTWLITTLSGASEKCAYSRSVVIPEVSL